MQRKTDGWESIYKNEGEIFSEPLPKIKKYANVFQKKGYSRILDLGCGTGRHSIYLAHKGFSVYSMDISRTGISILKTNAKNLDVKCKVHDMIKLPYKDNFFDAIICIFTMGHGTLDDAQKTINEMHRILKPHGMIITDFMSVKDKSYGKGNEIEKNTFLGSMQGEENLLHHYFTKKEILILFSKFDSITIIPIKYFHRIDAYDVEALK